MNIVRINVQGLLVGAHNRFCFQYYSIFILLVCITVMIVVSYLTSKPDYARISGLTYAVATGAITVNCGLSFQSET